MAQYEQSVLVAFKEVEDSLVAVGRYATSAPRSCNRSKRCGQHFSLANLRYKGGLANYLDVLIAQRNLFDAELALMGTHRLHLVSIVQLYRRLVGDGCQRAVTG